MKNNDTTCIKYLTDYSIRKNKMRRKKTRCHDAQYSGEVRWLAETIISNLHYSCHVINEGKHDEDDKYVLKWLCI